MNAAKASRLPTEDDLLLPFEKSHLQGDYKDYFKTKRNNFFATVQTVPGIWRCFGLLDEVWMREFEDLQRLRDVKQMLPAILFMNGHAQFRIAWELGFSCCVGEAWNVLRSGIESVAHAHKIHREPHLAAVWSAKDDGADELRAFKNAFERNKKESLFPAQHGLGTLHRYWSQFSELGTHTTVSSLARRFEEEKTSDDVNWHLEYFEADPERIAIFLFSLLLAAAYMEKAFFDCFETRLKLDPVLVAKRRDLGKAIERTKQGIIKRFDLRAPDIWP